MIPYLRTLSLSLRLVFAVALVILAGCPGGPSRIILPPETPVLGESTVNKDHRTSLVVETEIFLDLNLADDSGAMKRHTGYSVYDDRGELFEYVRNFIGTHDTEATVVELDPGTYFIQPDKPGRLPSLFRVVLEAGKRTKVEMPR